MRDIPQQLQLSDWNTQWRKMFKRRYFKNPNAYFAYTKQIIAFYVWDVNEAKYV